MGQLRETMLAAPLTISGGNGGMETGTVIVAPDTGPALILEDGAHLRGVTIRGRDRSERGAAVIVRGSGVRLEDCIIDGDASCGILVFGGELAWKGGAIRPGSGVGLMARGGHVRLSGVAIEGGRGAGLEVHEGGRAELDEVTVTGRGGDGIVVGALASLVMQGGAIAWNSGAAARILLPRSSYQFDRVVVRNNGDGVIDEGAEPVRSADTQLVVSSIVPDTAVGVSPSLAEIIDSRLVPVGVLAEALKVIDFVETELALPIDRFAPPLPLVRACLESPAQSPDRIAALAARLQSADSPSQLVLAAAAALRGGIEVPASSTVSAGLIVSLLRISDLATGWPDADELRRAMLDEEPDLSLLESHWMAPRERVETARLGAMARSVDPDSVADAIVALSRSSHPAAFAAARAAARPAPRLLVKPRATGGHTAFWTEAGWMVIGDSGPNSYGAGWTAILDPAGDDEYEDAGHAVGAGSLVVDLAGNDLYRGRTASAERGVSLVVDRSGDDRYLGARGAQASVSVGGALLWDESGDDLYEAHSGSQAMAVAGIALLADRSGRDRYEAASQSQAYAGPGGFAAIVDHDGDDRYTLTGGSADTLRNPNSRISFGQGLATGFRPGAAGGIAILSDGGGSDRYDASLFAQGCGYWGALGALVDADGSDIYLGWQYLQGSGVHGAVGILLDRGNGRDFYQAWTSAQGAGHDLALGVLVDEGGNDLYRSDNLTQGSGNANGTGILVDRAGDDIYMLEQSTLGQGHGVYENLSRRWGSLGVLLDLGGKDRYSGPGRDGTTWTQAEIGVGVDR